MKQQFAVMNMMSGEQEFFDTVEEAVSRFSQIAVEYAVAASHGVPCMVVNIADDGSETWHHPDGTPAQFPTILPEIKAGVERHVWDLMPEEIAK